jgi:hypothetical protein
MCHTQIIKSFHGTFTFRPPLASDMAGATIDIHFEGPDAERRFLRTYLADAWGRFESSDHWEHGWYWRYGQFADYDAGPDGGLVRLVFDGDPAALVDAETDRWAAFDGLVSWEVRRYDDADAVADADGKASGDNEAGNDPPTYDSLLAQQRDAKGAVGGEREYRIKPHTARLALALLAEFDDPLPADPEPSDDDPIGIGAWALLHDLLVQSGYDWYEETDVALRMARNRVKSIAGYRGADAARAEYERILTAWREFGDDLDEWLAEHPTGTMSEP